MKFGEKLILLRKKNNLSQEELAEKLGVSRQSVSKWEGNNSYPETDKIVQICNLFNVSMDDLINDNITDIDSIERKDKNNFNMALDSFLDFITKTINMFSDMKFTSGLKCIIEMFILVFILCIVGIIVVGATTKLIENVFYFIPRFNEVLHYTINSIIKLLYIIVSIIILVHTFKIRYLDYYEKVINNKNDDIKDDKKFDLKKENKIIIRDEKHRPFAFLSVLSNIIIFFIKFFLIFVIFGLILSIVFLMVSFVISIFLTPNSILFFGSDLAIIGLTIFNIILLIFIINFIFNKESKYKKLIITFIISIIIIGIGVGISVISVKNIKFEEYDMSNNIIKEENIPYNDNLVIVLSGLHDIEYKIDNSMNNDIKVLINYNQLLNNYRINKDDNYYGINTYEIHINDNTLSPKDLYELIIPDLKNNIIKSNYSKYTVTIVASSDVVNMLIDNSNKVYVFDKEQTNDGYLIKNISHKINKIDYCSEKTDYNAVSGEIITSGNCKCKIENNDEYVNFTCDYEYEE